MSQCPECKSENNYVSDGPYLDGFGDMYLTMSCDDCGAEWREEYAITQIDSEVTQHGSRYADE